MHPLLHAPEYRHRFDRLGQSHAGYWEPVPWIEKKTWSGMVRQVRTPQVLADVVWDTNDIEPDQYTIDFYTTETIDGTATTNPWPKDNYGYYIPQITPFVSWHVYKPTGAGPLNLVVRQRSAPVLPVGAQRSG